MMSERIVNLQEWRDAFLPGVTLSARDRRLADALGKVEIRDRREGVYIKATSWVGVVRFEAFALRIHPKLTNADIIRMLMVTSGLDCLRRYRATRDYQLGDDVALFDWVALLLADACGVIARDGLLRGYVVEEDDLPVIRGRLRMAEQVRRRYGQVNRLECRYDDHHADVVDNQILHTALALCRRYVRRPWVRARVQRLVDTFAAACSPLSGDWREIRAGLTYNRLNARYREAHTLSWALLDGMGVRDLMAAGHTSGFAFLLDMNPLFEAFVTALVPAVLRDDPVSIHAQARSGGHIWDVGRHQSYSSIIPDLLIETVAGKRLAVDAKYKLYDEHKLNQSDIYQTFLYAHAFRDPDGRTPSALLLYPSDGPIEQLTRLHIRDGRGAVQARLHAFGVNVSRALDELMGVSDGGSERIAPGVRQTIWGLLAEVEFA